MKVLLCGATGFIGSNVLRALSSLNEHEIRAVSYTRSLSENFKGEKLNGDLRDPKFVRSIVEDIDVVLQFAATTSGSKDILNQPSLHVTDNAVMNSYLLRAASEAGVKQFIFPSCTVMYQPSEKPLTENDFDANDDLYPSYFGVGHTKLYVEKLCKFYSTTSSMKSIVLRHSNVYGPGDKFDLEKSHFVGATIRKVIDAEDGDDILVWGDGKTARDLIYIDDFVNAVLACLQLNDSFNLFNVGYGKAWEVNEVVQEIIRISGKNIKIVNDTSKPAISTRLAIDSKFKSATNWQIQTDLTAGLELAYSWAKSNACG